MMQSTESNINVGDKIGYYQLSAAIPGGATDSIWLANDSLMNRRVAVKRLGPSTDIDEVTRNKFQQEANIQKQVSANHPNLADVIDIIEEPRGVFLVMEYIDGMSLESIFNRKPEAIAVAQVLPILEQITKALTALHNSNIIHRDLKPGNILMGNDGVVRIVDFGLATFVDQQETLQVGTARYMAPELFSSSTADPRADIYSLGLIVYEMLAGRAIFEDVFKNVLRDTRTQAMRWMKWHTNQRLQLRPLREINPELPPVLCELVERMTSKDPSQRVADANQLMQVLQNNFSPEAKQRAMEQQRLLQQQEAAAQQAATTQITNPTAPLEKPNRTKLYILAGVVGLMLFGGAVFGIYSATRPDPNAKVFETEIVPRYQQITTDYEGLMENRAENPEAFEKELNAVIKKTESELSLLNNTPEMKQYVESNASIAIPTLEAFNAASKGRLAELKASLLDNPDQMEFSKAADKYKRATELYATAIEILSGISAQSDKARDRMDKLVTVRERNRDNFQRARLFKKIEDLIGESKLSAAEDEIGITRQELSIGITEEDREILENFRTEIANITANDEIRKKAEIARQRLAQENFQGFIDYIEQLGRDETISNTSTYKQLEAMVPFVRNRLEWQELDQEANESYLAATKRYTVAYSRGGEPNTSGILQSAGKFQDGAIQSQEDALDIMDDEQYGDDRNLTWIEMTKRKYNTRLETLKRNKKILLALDGIDLERTAQETRDPKLLAIVSQQKNQASISKMIQDGNDIVNGGDINRIISELPALRRQLGSNAPEVWNDEISRAHAIRHMQEGDAAIAEADPMGHESRWRSAAQAYEKSRNEYRLRSLDAKVDRVDQVIIMQSKVMAIKDKLKKISAPRGLETEITDLDAELQSQSQVLGAQIYGVFSGEIEAMKQRLSFKNQLVNVDLQYNTGKYIEALKLYRDLEKRFGKFLSTEEKDYLDAQIKDSERRSSSE